MVEAYKKFWMNYVNFNDRTTAKDFWLTFLMNIIIGFAAGFIMGITKLSILSVVMMLYSLASIIPSLAMSVRRMHDINKSGWWLLISFVPLVGGIILIVFYCLPSVNENNNFGTQL